MRTRLAHAAFGVLATLFGVALAHLVAGLTDPAASPVLAVGSQVIDLTPTPMKEWAIQQFGTWDKPILIGSVFAGVLVLSAVAGLLTLRRFEHGAGLLIALVGLAAAATINRPVFEPVDLLPALAAAVGGVAALFWLHRAARPAPQAPEDAAAAPQHVPDEAPRASRRGVLVAAGVLAAAAAVLGGAGRWIAQQRTRISDVDLPAAANPAPPLPAGLEEKVPGISPFRTPNGDFYRVDTRLTLPVIDVDDWTLTIDGDVEEELTFTFEEILAMPMVERDITLTCVSNDVGGEYVGAARWLGVPLKDLLDRAGVGADADQLFSTDVEGMTISTPLDLATDGRDALLAVGMNGEPLPLEHGFPARLVIPGLYGFISATKWISRITLTTYAEQDSYWTKKKWATDAPIKISSRIDTPKSLTTIDPGDTFIGGVAWAQQTGGVARVEVRVDGGPWTEAKLGPDGGNDYWRQWYLPWQAESGQHSLAVRAINGDGETQTPVRMTPFPEGSSGVQEIVVTVA